MKEKWFLIVSGDVMAYENRENLISELGDFDLDYSTVICGKEYNIRTELVEKDD